MAEFDPETFEEEKYVEYFPDLQRAYKIAFEYKNERYDSELIHAIDQMVLNESEPFYEGDGEFRIELPSEEPVDRIQGVLVDEQKFEETLDIYLDRIESELQRAFGLESE